MYKRCAIDVPHLILVLRMLLDVAFQAIWLVPRRVTRRLVEVVWRAVVGKVLGPVRGVGVVLALSRRSVARIVRRLCAFVMRIRL